MTPGPVRAGDSDGSAAAALARRETLDTHAERGLDDLAHLAADLCGVPIAVIALEYAGRTWWSHVGVDDGDFSNVKAFCTQAILEAPIVELSDARDHPRLCDHPLVTARPHVRFCAGVPLITSSRLRVGTLCILDREPHRLSIKQRGGLIRIGRQAVHQLELRTSAVALREHASRLQTVADSVSEGIHTLDLSGTIVFENTAATRMLGRPAEALIGLPAHETIHHTRADGTPYPKDACPIYATRQDGASRTVTDEVFWRPDGTAVPVSYVTTPLRDESGDIVGVTVTFHDAGERRQREEAVARLAAVVDSADDAILTKTLDGVITSWNRAAERIFGYPAVEIVGCPFLALVPPERAHEEAEILRRIGLGELIPHFETERRRMDGTIVPIAATISPLRDGSGRVIGVSTIARDITEQKRAASREAEHRRVFAFQAEAALALTQGEDLSVQLGGCAAAFVKHLDAVSLRIWRLNREESTLEVVARAGACTPLDESHGRVPVGESRIGRIAAEGAGHFTNDVVSDPSVADSEWARREGIASFAGIPLTVAEELVGVVAMFARRPLSEATLQGIAPVANGIGLAIERNRTQELLKAKNEDLKGFAYTVSHDLKAPLRGILGYAQELERKHKAGLGERAQLCLARILTATRNLDELIDDLLEYSRLDREFPAFTRVDLAALVRSVLRDLERPIAEVGAIVHVSLPTAEVVGWERGLRQVFANLVDNALKYSRNAQPPRIEISGEVVPGGYRVSVVDNGIGFDMQYHDRMFGLFNRLVRAEQFEGTGAGLAIVKKVLQKQGGKIWAQSEPGRGASFVVELPTRLTGWRHDRCPDRGER